MPAPVTIADQVKDMGRELGMRRALYPRQIESGKLKQVEADHRLACADATFALLKRIQEGHAVGEIERLRERVEVLERQLAVLQGNVLNAG